MLPTTAPRPFLESGTVRAHWWHPAGDGRFQCDLCPRACRLAPGQRGFCFVRDADAHGLRLTSYGRASGFCIDPIEKKPLNHFFPGTSVLSFGTAGCNLGCRFCQNWDISKARSADRLSESAMPDAIARAAAEAGCRSLAFTYNDPVIFAEYAIDCALAARERGLASVAVTAGYILAGARTEFYRPMDAANVDLKAFSEAFYKRQCIGELAPVLETLCWLKRETSVWLEVTTLLIPGLNDSEREIGRLCDWYLENLGPDTPLHFTAFHPDYKLTELPPTPPSTVRKARRWAMEAGLRYVYTGNIRDPAGQTTTCPRCQATLVARDGYELRRWGLTPDGACAECGEKVPGRFDKRPGSWGSRRERLRIGSQSQ
ncbi:MAG: AmmeMemoRadiSam system radical SAM enzyme [Verrucomicrobiales bacterium]|nr:AmmeMemoRadiSam system radical SAM enzyme [Verrucomicrobiales bacterium]